MQAPTPKSLVLDLLSTLRGGSMPVSALVAAGELFGLGESSVRVAVTRLRASGLLERDERGRYRLGPGAAPVEQRVRSWRRLEERLRPWQGGFLAVQAGPGRSPRRRAAARHQQALRLLGFATLAPGLHVRPDNLRGGATQARAELAAFGGTAPGTLVFAMVDLDRETRVRARALWDAEALQVGYARSLSALARSGESLPDLPEEAAMVESFLLGGRVIRQLVLDPLLPEPIGPSALRRALVEAMRRYDRLGRRAWAAFLARFGVTHAAAPAHTRGLSGASPLALH